MPAGGFRFERPVIPNGYAWWYLDALSDDGRHGLTLIAFIGSVFSPFYAWARRRGPADPANFCAVNVALYGPARRWAMTERGRGCLERGESWLRIGRSALAWDGTALTVSIDETGAPLPCRIKGMLRVLPEAVEGRAILLDPAGRHRWSPIAPCARIEVSLDRPALAWAGGAYCDTNAGDVPLEEDFASWHWSRAPVRGGTAVFYDVTLRDGTERAVALRYDRGGGAAELPPPPVAALPSTRWRIARAPRNVLSR